MTLDEAIKHCEEVAEEKDKSVELYKAVKATEGLITKCEDCAKEHRQLAEWLMELKAYKDNRCALCHSGKSKGRWEYLDHCAEWYRTEARCSVCGDITIDDGNFCPNCGADMRE